MMEIIIIALLVALIIEGYFIYKKLIQIEYTIQLIESDTLDILRNTKGISKDILSQMSLLLKKELIVKNVLRVP